jgi:haloalkane dehalogenase
VVGNTWFWPSDRRARAFDRVMSTRPMRGAILERNFFVERFVPFGVDRRLSEEEMEHYRAVQPTPAHRVGILELPRQIVAAGPWLEALERTVAAQLGDKRTLIIWPDRDTAFPQQQVLPRIRSAFRDATVVHLPAAKHFFQEDAPGEVAAAIIDRFARSKEFS